MSISLVAAVAKNNVIGKANALPWYIPEDLKRFKKLTTGHVVLMGQKTFDSIMDRLKKPLPDRINVVLSRNPDFHPPAGVRVFHDLLEAITAFGGEEIFVIGGGSIFQQTIDLASTLYITHVDQEVDGDVFFPKIDPLRWKQAGEEIHKGFSFATYVRPRVFSQSFVVVGAIIQEGGKILLVREGAHSKADQGKWNQPAGWVEPGEDPLVAVKREVQEETGFEFFPEHILGIYSLVRADIYDPARGLPHGVKIIFLGRITNSRPADLASDVTEAKWFEPNEISEMDPKTLRDLDIKQMVKDYFAGKKYPLELLTHTVSK